jgi:ribonuclease VapC
VGQVFPLTSENAKTAGTLVLTTPSLGLSFGDRVCLGLALEHKVPVYTAERFWKNLKLDLPINLIRSLLSDLLA